MTEKGDNMTDLKAYAKKIIDYRNRNDFEHFFSCFDENLEFITLEDNKVLVKGKDQLKQFIDETPHSKEVTWEIDEMVQMGNKLFTHERLRDFENHTSEYMFIYEFKDDRIKKAWYIDK